MNKTGKTQALLTSLLIILSCLILPIVGSANVQAVSNPSVPEFTIKYVDHSYDIPATYGTDQYTGETIVTKPGEHIDNRTVEITIKNQPFTPFNDSSGHTINRFFDVRYKGSYGEDWTTMFRGQTQWVWYGQSSPYIKYGYAIQDYSAHYTTIIYKLSPNNGKMDFQVQALEGYTNATYRDSHIFFADVGFSFYGKSSDWSNTQTISFPDGIVTTLPNTDTTPTNTQTTEPITTPAPSVPEFSVIAILPLFVIALLAVFAVKSKARFIG